jgi:plastocyanin
MERRLGWSVRMSEEGKERTMKDDTRALAWYRWALVAAGAMALLIGAHALAATPPTIEIKEFKYGPPVLSVPVGTTLTWVNHDEEPHTVTSATGAFSSAGLVNDDTFVETFTKPGTYQYFCKIHPYMKGTVVVK